ncbi:MAG: response regulator [Firmicutes bacterium]|nr:response regulator [Bacillota bacterium]
MIKVLLAEDDIEMLEGLTNAIDWQAHGFTIVGAVRDGAAALDTIKKTVPDLIITDITMPRINGLELIRRAKELQPKAKSIIISCHEEFEFAREAIRLQADEYLLKHTLTEDMLLKAIIKLKTKIAAEAEQLHNYYGLDSAPEHSFHLTEWANLYDTYSPILKKAVRDGDALTLSKKSNELIKHINEKKYHPSSQKAVLSKILIELALIMPDTRGISVEALQLKGDNYSFQQGIQVIIEKLANYRYNTKNKDVLKAIAYIEEHLHCNFSCKSVARHINMNSSYFSRLFKKETGFSFSNFVLQKRIDKATELLYNTRYNVDEIVRMVGIESVSYFYRIYKRMTGNTPGDVRNSK